DRAQALVRSVGEGVVAALASRKVAVLRARGTLTGPDSVALTGEERRELRAESIILATGTRWERPSFPGIPDERILTADQVQRLRLAPASALVLAGGPSQADFALEYAFLLAAAGSEVTLAVPRSRLLDGLDPALDEVARAALADAGITVLLGATLRKGDGATATVAHRDGTAGVAAEAIVVPDPRRHSTEGLGLEAAGLPATDTVAIDAGCRTAVPSILAAGDVAGGPMLTAAALEMGRVAGLNATGGEARARLGALPHVLHLQPEVAWAGMTEEAARAAGYDVCVGLVDLSFNPKAVTLGQRGGVLKLIGERELGEVLGVHAVGPGAEEIVALAAAAMQAENTLDDLAATVHWHPSMAESLADAARRALRG
ncbi:MAG TPA: NAD(P)/FAD-dependent oxidoreductase, partial [Dehalococcoidia bacterium]|nr:NAD(P)/FAD-dependent oxidoreductase [Dehalococcoidia bacterium]